MNRDDTYKVTREDVWRELELLPAWKLRTPIKTVLPNAVEKVAIESLAIAEVATVAAEKPASTVARQYEITLSQDKYWAFVCEFCLPAERMDAVSQSILFNNILQALHVEKPTKTLTVNIDAKIIVAFGESAAQTLLNSQEKLENLRGKLHEVGDSKLIATYDLAHLLALPLDKAKVWQDLCLARAYLQNIQP